VNESHEASKLNLVEVLKEFNRLTPGGVGRMKIGSFLPSFLGLHHGSANEMLNKEAWLPCSLTSFDHEILKDTTWFFLNCPKHGLIQPAFQPKEKERKKDLLNYLGTRFSSRSFYIAPLQLRKAKLSHVIRMKARLWIPEQNKDALERGWKPEKGMKGSVCICFSHADWTRARRLVLVVRRP